MALLNFLYKDIDIINSIYAQIFRGKLTQIDHIYGNNKNNNGELGFNAHFITAKKSSGDGITEQRKEIIDPHDASTIDVLVHLQNYAVDEEKATNGDIVILSGELIIIPHEIKKNILNMAFESNKEVFRSAMKADIKTKKDQENLFSLVKEQCIGSPEQSLLFFRSKKNILYLGSIKNDYISYQMHVLSVAHSSNLIPVNMIALYLGKTNTQSKPEETGGMDFARLIQFMISFANRMLALPDTPSAVVTPLAFMLEINAEIAPEE